MDPFARSRPDMGGNESNAICWIRWGENIGVIFFYRRSIRVTVRLRRSFFRRVLVASPSPIAPYLAALGDHRYSGQTSFVPEARSTFYEQS